MDKRDTQRVMLCFGKLLDYPGPQLAEQAREGAGWLRQSHAPAAEQLDLFLAFVERTPLGQLEEIYTGTFDLNPACYIFAGYMLFGESFKRGKFLVGLQERYAERGFSSEVELADHLAVVFKFLATLEPDDVLAGELSNDCLLPVLKKMNANFARDDKKINPYAHVLRAILHVLERAVQRVPVAALGKEGL